jgi:hypothetical protein
MCVDNGIVEQYKPPLIEPFGKNHTDLAVSELSASDDDEAADARLLDVLQKIHDDIDDGEDVVVKVLISWRCYRHQHTTVLYIARETLCVYIYVRGCVDVVLSEEAAVQLKTRVRVDAAACAADLSPHERDRLLAAAAALVDAISLLQCISYAHTHIRDWVWLYC